MKDSKTTFREHYQSVYRQTGVAPVELDNEQQIPDELKYIWNWFQELNRARGSSGFGPSPISYMELDAWSRLTGVILEKWEIDAIKDLDMTFMMSVLQKQE